MRRVATLLVVASLVAFASAPARATRVPGPLAQLRSALRQASHRAPGEVAMEVRDLSTGFTSAVNANEVMPAASTIKVPIMVEVFRQLQAGTFDLNRHVTLMPGDRDWGSGSLCDAPAGTTYPVSQLLQAMITVSDNTAANMLIRLVGRPHINATMHRLGLRHTQLADYIHTGGANIRSSLRTTPADMVSLLTKMAKDNLIDEWSSRQMIAIMEAQEINTLLPGGLPVDVTIAHKTGSLHDTLNDVGIVYADNEPYVIAIMTTNLPTLSAGRRFIHHVSNLAYTGLERFAKWRESHDPSFMTLAGAADTQTPDIPMWGPQANFVATPIPHATQAPDSGG